MPRKSQPKPPCSHCSGPILGRVRNRPGPHFCSKTCSGLYHRILKSCTVCGKKLPHQERRYKLRTCSDECRTATKTGRKRVEPGTPLGTNKQNFKRVFAPTRGNCCQLCGFSNIKILQVHQVVPQSKGGTDELSNLLLVCPNCHAEVHHDGRPIPDTIRSFLATQVGFLTAPPKKPKQPKSSGARKPRAPRAPRTQPVGSVCSLCGAPTRRGKNRCSKCFHKSREKIQWPSDQELAKIVWLEPIVKLAKKLGVSDVAIKHRCRHRKILTPGRGHWAKIYAATAA